MVIIKGKNRTIIINQVFIVWLSIHGYTDSHIHLKECTQFARPGGGGGVEGGVEIRSHTTNQPPSSYKYYIFINKIASA